MPNLSVRQNEIAQLIAFLKYTSEMNTEGWPPKPKVNGLSFALATPMPAPLRRAPTPPLRSIPSRTASNS